MPRARALAAVLALALAANAVAVSPAVASAPVGSDGDASPVGATVTVNRTVSPGEVVLTYRYSVGEDVEALSVWLPHRNATSVLATRGFEADADEPGNYEWERGDAPSPYVRVRIEVSAATLTTDGRGVDPGPWALLKRPFPGVYYHVGEWKRHDAIPTVTATGDDRAAGGRDMLYVGAYAAHTRTATTNETFHLIVPETATLEPTPGAVLSGLTNASETLDVGPRREDVYAFAVPRSVSSRWSGMAVGDSFWAMANASLDHPGSVWLHEYVHTRQRWESAEDFWFDEGSAVYLTALLALHQDRTTYRETYAFLRRVGDEDGVLADPPTWRSESTQYGKGARVLAAVDARIRGRTNYTRWVADAFRRLNGRSGEVTNEDVIAAASAVTGDARTGTFVRQYTETGDLPEMPVEPTTYALLGADDDGDGLDTAAERRYGTHPFRADTDGDGPTDPRELDLRTNATRPDTDDDGFEDGDEIGGETNATDPDTDGDGLEDGTDECPTTPEDADGHADDDGCPEEDADGDGLDDGRERSLGTDPTDPDTDGDGLEDGDEVAGSTDPLTADAAPGTSAEGDGRSTAENRSDPAPGNEESDGIVMAALGGALLVLAWASATSGLLTALTLVNAGISRTAGVGIGWLDRRSIERLTGMTVAGLLLTGGVTVLIYLHG